jgi:hypothetical protein
MSSVTVRFCKLYPYYTSFANTTRLYCGIFRQEPAIARLDWLFTPTRKSSECMYTTTVRPSILLSENFSLLTSRSSGSGSYPSDSRPFRLAFAEATKFNLATLINSLDHFSKRTLQLREAVTIMSLLNFKSFNPRLRVLFSFPSRYLFTIGLECMFRVRC